MAPEPNDHRSEETSLAGSRADSSVVDVVQQLTWAVLDDQITDDEIDLLDSLLLSDDEARQNYVGCVQLHVGLLEHFATDSAEGDRSGASSVLSFLNEGMLPFGAQPSKP